MSTTKMLGLVLAAMCVLIALPGLAAASEFEAEDYPAEVDAQQLGNHVFTAEGGISVQCTAVNLEGEIDQWSETEELSATYGGCTASGFAATVAMNGCTYVFHAGEELEEAGDFGGAFDVKCPAEKAIAISAATCEIQIGPQAGLTEIEYDNNPEATPDNITGTAAITGIAYTKIKDGIFCPLGGTGVKEDGAYSGSMLVTAEAAEEQVGIGVNKTPNTRICKKEPKPNCDAYPANTALEGKGEAPADVVTFLNLREPKGPSKVLVVCRTTKLTAEMEAEQGVPMKAIAFEFDKCENFADGKTCTVRMENKPAKGTIRWQMSKDSKHSGLFQINAIAIFVECKGQVRCEYVKAPFFTLFEGGASPTMVFIEPLKHTTIVPEEGCWAQADFSNAKLSFVKPGEMWLVQ